MGVDTERATRRPVWFVLLLLAAMLMALWGVTGEPGDRLPGDPREPHAPPAPSPETATRPVPTSTSTGDSGIRSAQQTEPAPRVFGTVTTAAGTPIPELELLALAPDAEEIPPYHGVPDHLASTRTDRHGKFELVLPRPGAGPQLEGIRIVQTEYVFLGQDRQLRKVGSSPIVHRLPGGLVNIRVTALGTTSSSVPKLRYRLSSHPGVAPKRCRRGWARLMRPKDDRAEWTTRIAFRKAGELTVDIHGADGSVYSTTTMVVPLVPVASVLVAMHPATTGSIRVEFVDDKGQPTRHRCRIRLVGRPEGSFDRELAMHEPRATWTIDGLPCRPLDVYLRRIRTGSSLGRLPPIAQFWSGNYVVTPTPGSPTALRHQAAGPR